MGKKRSPGTVEALDHHANQLLAAAKLKLPPAKAVRQVVVISDNPKYQPDISCPYLGADAIYDDMAQSVKKIRKGARVIRLDELKHRGDSTCAACPACRRPKGHPLACALEIDPKLF